MLDNAWLISMAQPRAWADGLGHAREHPTSSSQARDGLSCSGRSAPRGCSPPIGLPVVVLSTPASTKPGLRIRC
jgi:hypothetical protein